MWMFVRSKKINGGAHFERASDCISTRSFCTRHLAFKGPMEEIHQHIQLQNLKESWPMRERGKRKKLLLELPDVVLAANIKIGLALVPCGTRGAPS